MGLLDQTNNGKSYLDYYKNYRGPSYNWEWSKQTTAPTETATQAGLLSSIAPPVINGGGDGFGPANAGFDGKLGTTESAESVGSIGVDNGRGTLAAIAAMGLNAAVPGLSTVSTVSGLLGGPTTKDVAKAAVNTLYGSPDKYSGLDFGKDAETAARAQMDAQARENDANRGYGGYDAFSDSRSLADAVASGNWGGSADYRSTAQGIGNAGT